MHLPQPRWKLVLACRPAAAPRLLACSPPINQANARRTMQRAAARTAFAHTWRQQRLLARLFVRLVEAARLNGRVVRRRLAHPAGSQAAAAGVHALARALLCAQARRQRMQRMRKALAGCGSNSCAKERATHMRDALAGRRQRRGRACCKPQGACVHARAVAAVRKQRACVRARAPATCGWMHRFLRELSPSARMGGGAGQRYLLR